LAEKHAPLAHHFENLEQQRRAQLAGMWTFLATEVLVFGAMFTGYAAYRTWYPEAFAEASRHLSLLIGGINTVVLLASSFTMAMSVYAARTGRRTWLVGGLLLTILLGSAFMGIKAVEYYVDYRDSLMPLVAFEPQEWVERGIDPRPVVLFLTFYYILTGLHALHLVIGIGLLAVILYFAWRDTYSPEYYIPVDLSGLYWHFVDIVWIFLLPLLYLVGTRSL